MIRFPAGRSSTSTPGSPPSSSASTSRSRPSPPGNSVRRDLLEVLRDRRERLGEAALDRRRELGAELLELLEALLEILALRPQVVEALLLGVVLLSRERIDLTERGATYLEPFDAARKLVAILSLGRLDVARRLETPRSVCDVGVDPRDLDLGCGHGRARLLELAPQIHLGGSERPELLAELARPRAIRRRPAREAAPRSGPPRVRTASIPSRSAVAMSTRRPSVACVDRRSTQPRRLAERSLGDARPFRRHPRRRASPPRPRRSSAAASAASAVRRPCSSSSTASAVSPTNHSSPRPGS